MLDDSPSECEIEREDCDVDEHMNPIIDKTDIMGNTMQAELDTRTFEMMELPGPKDILQSPDDDPNQPMENIIPSHLIERQYRRFSPHFYRRHPWIKYSENADAIFCFHCQHFAVDPRLESAFREEGNLNWKKCYGNDNRLKGLCRDFVNKPIVREKARIWQFVKRANTFINGGKATRSLVTNALLIVFHGQLLKWRVNSTHAKLKKAAYSQETKF